MITPAVKDVINVRSRWVSSQSEGSSSKGETLKKTQSYTLDLASMRFITTPGENSFTDNLHSKSHMDFKETDGEKNKRINDFVFRNTSIL